MLRTDRMVQASYLEIPTADYAVYRASLKVQWNLGIRETQGTAKNCPEF